MRSRTLWVIFAFVACSSAGPHAAADIYGTDDPEPPQRKPSDAKSAKPTGKLTPTGEKAASFREAASLLDKAQAALTSGNRNLAELLFSTAELIVGPEAVQSIASTFRAGSPPRVTTPTTKVDVAAPPQPKVMGSSEQEDAEARVTPPPVQASLTGKLMLDGKGMNGTYGLVTLEPERGKWSARTPKRRTIEQRNREFFPRLMAVPVGSTVVFPNFDSVFHNVFSATPLSPFDLGIYKDGQAREYTFTKEGIVRLACNLHAGMTAYVAVVSAPIYMVTDANGAFEFKRLAPGNYKLKAWTERSKAPVSQTISIKRGANTVDIGAAGDAPAEKAPDKFGGKRG